METQTYALDTTWRTLLRDLGVHPLHVLRRAGLPDNLLEQPAARLPAEAYYRFWESIERETSDPLFPIRLVKAIRSESFSPPLFAALCSPNLAIACRRIAHYKKLVAPMRLLVSEDAATLRLDLDWPTGPLLPPMSLVMTELLFFVSLARMGTREPLRPTGVFTTVLPTPVGPYEEFLLARLSKGTTHSVSFTHTDATRPFLTANEPLWATFEPQLRQRLAELDSSEGTSQRVKSALLEGLPSGVYAMSDVAQKLGVSKRTLQRRIEAEGFTFQQILNQTRESLAMHYLEKTHLPAAEISFLLGFHEPNSFYRAFRAWTGQSPESVRKAHKEKS